MTPRFARTAVLIPLALILIGCGGHIPRSAAEPETVKLGNVMSCRVWNADESKGAGIGEAGAPTPGLERFESVRVVLHLMLARIEPRPSSQEYNLAHAWALAPEDEALAKELSNVFPGQPNTKNEFWTFPMIKRFFSKDDGKNDGKDGKVNQILGEAFLSREDEKVDPWKGPGIRLVLVRGENCGYSPRMLRPDGLARDSMPTPQTSIPWTNQLFRSINRLFANQNPGDSHMLHVFVWWSVGELDIDDVDAVRGGTQIGDKVWGYSRSATRGGPAVWIGAHQCLKHPRLTDPDDISFWYGRCAKVIAHEVGHALGLHHVEGDFTRNLMYEEPSDKYVNEEDKGVILSAPQKQQMLREVREQFGSQ